MSLVGSYAFYGKLLHDLFVAGQAKVEIVRAANVVIEQVVGTVEVRLTGTTIMMPVDIQGSTIMMPIDIQGATIMMPVDIQAQYMDIDVRITGQVGNLRIDIAEVSYGEINIKTAENTVLNIWTPGGRIVSAAGIIGNWYYDCVSILSGSTGYIPVGGITTTKPAKVASIGIYVTGAPVTDSNVFDDVTIKFVIDGASLMEFTPRQIDYLSGAIVTQLLEAGTLPDGTTVMSLASPLGGISAVTFDAADNVIWKVGFFVNFEVEFDDSFEIQIVNNTGVTIDTYVSIYWGYYR